MTREATAMPVGLGGGPALGMSSWRGVLALSVSETISWGALYYSFGVLALPLGTTLGVSAASASGAFSLALLVAGLAAQPVGRWLDRRGARGVMTAGAATAAASLALLATVDSVVGLYLVWSLVGLSQAAVLYEPAFAAITSWFPRPVTRQRALLVVTSVGGLASTVFVPLVTELCVTHGWRAATLVLAAVVALVVLPLHATLPKTTIPPVAAARPAVTARCGTRCVRPLALVFAIHSLVATATAAHLLLHLTAVGRSPAEGAWLWGLVGVAQVGGRLLGPLVVGSLGDSARLPGLLALQAVALGAFTVVSGPVLALAVIGFGFSAGLITLERPALVAAWFGTEAFGTVSGRVASIALSTRAAGPVALGWLAAHTSYSAAFITLAGLIGATALAFHVMVRRQACCS